MPLERKICPSCGVRFKTYMRSVTCSTACRDIEKKKANVELRRAIRTPEAPKGARWIPLTRGKFVLVDADLYEPLMQDVWYFNTNRKDDTGYAARRVRNPDRIIWLHRVVMEEPKGLVDHRDRNTLDCRRQNLRVITEQESNANRRKHTRAGVASIYKGVCKPKDYKKWQAIITIDSRTIRLGTFADEIEAARAYDAAARKAWGEHACLNFST